MVDEDTHLRLMQSHAPMIASDDSQMHAHMNGQAQRVSQGEERTGTLLALNLSIVLPDRAWSFDDTAAILGSFGCCMCTRSRATRLCSGADSCGAWFPRCFSRAALMSVLVCSLHRFRWVNFW
jgi:hypothetical protein